MATWTTPKTWTDTTVSASELNTHLRDNLTYLYDRDVGLSPTTSSDQTRNSATLADLTGMSFSCESGKNYTIVGVIGWAHSATGGGPLFSFNHSGGNGEVMFAYNGGSSATSQDRNWITSPDGGSGLSATDSAGTRRVCQLYGSYQCGTSGTWTVRWARNTTGTLTVRAGSSLFVTSD